MTATGLAVDDVHVRYGDVHAVRGVSFRFPPTRMLALTGSSGAGKSSLMWALAGALTPSSGSVRLDTAAIIGREDAVAKGVVIVP